MDKTIKPQQNNCFSPQPLKHLVSADWTIQDSEKLYHMTGWGEPYFSINQQGHVTVAPQGEKGDSLDLFALIQSLKQRNLELPILIRFSDILGDRLARLCECMQQAITRYNYPNSYCGVFPIKCNQNRHLVESVVKFGKAYNFGLEAGSKPELIIALALLEANFNQAKTQQPLLICNGYKDKEYIETALLATKLGQKPIIVIEQLSELHLLLKTSRQLGIKPILGVRAKLSSKGIGRWGNSTGERAKFGLTVPEIMQAYHLLQQAEMPDCLQLLHFHIGSQISAIATIKAAIREASRIYVELAKLTGSMQYLDVGGGLAVDYNGSKTQFYASKNYNMQNYAYDIVAELKEACDAEQVQPPILISESGRAIASHQSVLVFDIVGTNAPITNLPPSVAKKENLIIRNLWETYQLIDTETYQEAYNDAIQFKEEAISLFNFGYLSLEERARAEQLYWACCQKIWQIIAQLDYVPEDCRDLENKLAAIYYANFSIFQSLPDAWAIGQLFPIMPIHRLQEKPTIKAVLADLTCDSDGCLENFIDLQRAKKTLELHPLIPQPHSQSYQPYYLGVFLVGSYQEIMGNLHNLFGDTNVVHINMTAKGYNIEYLVRGNTINEVLNYVQYDGQDLLEIMRQRTEKALQENTITLEESQLLLQNYQHSLMSYTYLTPS